MVTSAQLYRTTIVHERARPIVHGFSYRHTMWLVDLDDVPRLPRVLRPLLRFDARDHLGDPTRAIRANVDAFLADRGIAAPHRILMLANPRSFGHCFNPLTVYWCYSRGDAGSVPERRAGSVPERQPPVPNGAVADFLGAIVAEVHNTYGERHCYLLRPDDEGRAETGKELYVSPFFPVDGRYEMRFTEPGDRLDLRITLRRGARAVFRASLVAREPVAVRSVVAAALRHPLPSWWVTARIRIQGVLLWLRRVPLVPRPPHVRQEGV